MTCKENANLCILNSIYSSYEIISQWLVFLFKLQKFSFLALYYNGSHKCPKIIIILLPYKFFTYLKVQ